VLAGIMSKMYRREFVLRKKLDEDPDKNFSTHFRWDRECDVTHWTNGT